MIPASLRTLPAFSAVLLTVACGKAPPVARPAGPIVVREAWVRSADSGDMGGAYLTLTNVDTMAVTIRGVSTPVAASAELHETMQVDRMVHMMARPDIAIARDSTLTMAPGGLHIMLTALNRALRVGDTVPMTLTLADGRTVPVAMPVRAP